MDKKIGKYYWFLNGIPNQLQTIDADDTIDFTLNSDGFLHSFNNQPALFTPDRRYLYWFKNGYLHNENNIGFYNRAINKSEYYIENKQLTKRDWEIAVNRINMLKEC